MMDEQIAGCILAGSIGDAWGSSYENEVIKEEHTTFYWGGKPERERAWMITDDTQLTLATCEVLTASSFQPEKLLGKFLDYYRRNKLRGLGSATLKAITDFDAGIPYTQTGRSGDYAAGNGAAMRISPFAFFPELGREEVYAACRITHRNEEAYAGALAVYYAIKAIINKQWDGYNDLLALILPELPDTLVKDRLIELSTHPEWNIIEAVAKLGNSAYVVDSVPFAIFCATKVREMGLERMFAAIIAAGGDTDTNASIAGQIAGTLIGAGGIPAVLINQLKQLKEYDWIDETIQQLGARLRDRNMEASG